MCRSTLWQRAAFDLSCSELELGDQVPDPKYVTVGVSGCVKRATYKWVEARGTGWVMNSSSERP